MAVSKTGAMFKSLTFDGEDSRDYGVYITGQAVFNAPEREVEMISIPGRNGQFALDKGRFENIEVTYPAGIFATTEADFAEAVSNFRNLLCSKRGYVRLQDEYHPDEYRMAIYKSGLELENVALKAGEFEITFDCKPQRYLTSGEEENTVVNGGTLTNPTLFDAEPLLEVEGYGTIGFNGYEVEIENKAIGTVSVHNTEDNETSFSIDTTVLNSGNTFIIPANSLWVRAIYSNIDKSLLGSNGTVALTRVNTWTRQFVNEPGNVNYCKLYLDAYNTDLTFTYGTSSTIAWYIVVRLEYNGSLYNTSARCDVAYDGNGTITLTPSSSTETTWTLDSSSSSTKAGYEVLGNSTKYVSPTYIDMEIGEAYGFVSSEIVSLNNVVSLPSDLPKLAPGTNTFTIDNTITQLKVVPRWWKV